MKTFFQLYLPGAVPLWCATFFALAALWGYSLVLRGDEDARRFARRGYLFFTWSIVLTSAVLLLCLIRRDFRIEYVYQYSGLDLQTHYQIAAFWAGQKGSFLIWLLWGALLGLPLRYAAGQRDEAPVMGVYLLTLFGLLFILVRENPFVMLDHTPADGAGLNPLLQDDWMVIHPPIMFIGYAAAAIPFAFALAAMWRRDTSSWANKTFPWALGGFLVLGTAILMGGYWAYKTLGWGGYWGWDPVENASLIPWIFGTVLIHGLYLERTRNRYRRANLVIACLLYLAVLYGTFLTRSGVLADFSVHSFVDLGISGWLIALMAFFLLASVYLLATRLREVPTQENEDPLFSRGAFMMIMTIVVLVSGVVITLGTSAPLLTRFLENPGQVGPEFYNRVNLPLAILMVFLLSFIPFLTWKETPLRELARKLVPGAVAALVITGIALANRVFDVFHLAFFFFAALALATNLQKVIELARTHGLAKVGGYLSHVGVGIMFIGILASSAYDQSTKVTLEQGVAQKVDELTLTFKRFIPRQGHEKERLEIEVVRDDGMTYLSYPKLFVNDRTRQLMVNPHIHKLLFEDLYISPIEFDPGAPPGVDQQLVLTKNARGEAGDLEIRFIDFDLSATGNPMMAFAAGRPVTIGVQLEVRQRGAAAAVPVTAFYQFSQNGQVETPPVELPGGGWVAMTGLNPNTEEIQLNFGGIKATPKLASVAIDVTQKPLITLVWWGLYVVLIGGAISTFHRYRAARQVEQALPATPDVGS